MEHTMKLFPSPFENIRNGNKTIELRLYDEKRRNIHIGDRICFVNSDDSSQTLTAEVVNLFIFDSFATLYQELSLLECGYTIQNVGTASPRDMDAYYTKEQQEKYGVVGIQIKLL